MCDATSIRRSLAGLCAAAGALLLAAGAGAEPVPLTRAPSGHFVLDVSISGDGPWPFVVDTGASHTAVALPLAERFGFVSTRETLDDVQALTARFEAERFTLEDVRFGAERIAAVDAVVVEIAPDETLSAWGLLGADVFGARRMRLDLAAGALILDEAAPAHADGLIDPETGLLFAEARADRVSGPIAVLVDTGATRTLINPVLGRRLALLGPVTSLRVGGVDGGRLEEVEAVTLTGLRVGGVCAGVIAAGEADLDIFRALGWSERPALVLGLDVLEDAAIVVDRAEGVVEISPGGGRAACRRGRVQHADAPA